MTIKSMYILAGYIAFQNQIKQRIIMKNRRIALVIALFSLLHIVSFAQEDESNSTKKHEVSIIFDDIFKKEIVVSDYYYYPYSSVPEFSSIYLAKAGLGYKYHFDKLALSSRITFGSDNFTNEEEDRDNKYSYIQTEAKLGVESYIGSGKAQFIYGINALYNYSGYDYERETGSSTQNIEVTQQGYGLGIVLGAKYYITPMLSVSTEIRPNIEFYNSKRTNTYKDDAVYYDELRTVVTSEESETSGMRTNFGPVGNLSINIHL